MTPPKRIALLGATGSIGLQALDVIAENPDLFSVSLLTAHSSVDKLVDLARKFRPDCVVLTKKEGYPQLQSALSDLPIRVLAGEEDLLASLSQLPIDLVVASMVGYSGLKPVLRAIQLGKDIALANKETLVVAGSLVMEEARKHSVSLFPIDSEHSAIWQCLMGESSPIAKVWLTASGGPFRQLSLEQMANVTVQEALKHPNWTMGDKITIDSATMMNKGFEMIEACHLFGITSSQVQVVVHPQSIVHSMVQFLDGSVKAQLGQPDMRLPIALALNEGNRISNTYPPFDFLNCHFDFLAPDFDKFPCLRLAYEAINQGGTMPLVLNGANEVLNQAFREGRIRFTQIAEGIETMMSQIPYSSNPSFEDLWEWIAKVEQDTTQYLQTL